MDCQLAVRTSMDLLLRVCAGTQRLLRRASPRDCAARTTSTSQWCLVIAARTRPPRDATTTQSPPRSKSINWCSVGREARDREFEIKSALSSSRMLEKTHSGDVAKQIVLGEIGAGEALRLRTVSSTAIWHAKWLTSHEQVSKRCVFEYLRSGRWYRLGRRRAGSAQDSDDRG